MIRRLLTTGISSIEEDTLVIFLKKLSHHGDRLFERGGEFKKLTFQFTSPRPHRSSFLDSTIGSSHKSGLDFFRQTNFNLAGGWSLKKLTRTHKKCITDYQTGQATFSRQKDWNSTDTNLYQSWYSLFFVNKVFSHDQIGKMPKVTCDLNW
jgi:hypothetical protein